MAIASGKGIGSFYVEIGADSSQFIKEMESVKRSIKKALGPEALATSKDLLHGFEALSLGIVAFAAASIKMSVASDQTRMSLTVLMGSVERATSLIEDMHTIAGNTPFEFHGVMEAAKKLTAFGLNVNQTKRAIQGISDVTAAMGGGPEKFDEIATAVARITENGVASGRELKSLSHEIPGLWEMLAQSMGKTVLETQDISQAKGISSGAALEAIFAGIQQRYGGTAAAMAGETAGMWTKVIDEGERAMKSIGKQLSSAIDLKGLTKSVLDAMTSVRSAIEANGVGGAISGAFTGLGEPTRIAILGIAGALMGSMIPALSLTATITRLAFVPLIPFAAQGLLVAAAIYTMYRAWTEGGPAAQAVVVGLGAAVGVMSMAMILNSGAITATLVPALGVFVSAMVRATAACAAFLVANGAWVVAGAIIIGALAGIAYYIDQNAGMMDALKIALVEMKYNFQSVCLFLHEAAGNLLSSMQGYASSMTQILADLMEKLNVFSDDAVLRVRRFAKGLSDASKESAAGASGDAADRSNLDAAKAIEVQMIKTKAAARDAKGATTDFFGAAKAAVSGWLGGAKEAYVGMMSGSSSFAGIGAGKAPKVSGGGNNQLVNEAKQVHNAIRAEWLRTTQTEETQLDIWYAGELSKLEESKVANKNYAEDRLMIDQGYSAKRREIWEKDADEARQLDAFRHKQELDRIAAAKELIGVKKDIGGKFAGFGKDAKGPTGELQSFFDGMKQQTTESIRGFDDYCAELVNKWDAAQADMSETASVEEEKRAREMQATIKDALQKAGVDFKVSEDGKLSLAAASTQQRLALMARELEETMKAKQSGALIEKQLSDDLNNRDLVAYMAHMNAKTAAFMSQIEGEKSYAALYRQIQTDANRSMLSYMSQIGQAAYSGITGAITDMIMGTQTAGQAMQNLGKQIVGMIVQFMAQRLVASMLSRTLGTAEMAQSMAAGTAVAASWAPAAAMVSLATFGSNAIAASAGIAATTGLAATLSMFKPMAKGGIVSKPTLALIGEAGPEAVVPLGKGGGGIGGRGVIVNVHNNTGTKADVRQESTFDGQDYVVNVFLDAFGRNKNGLRTVLGR